MKSEQEVSSLELLGKKVGRQWKTIAAAKETSHQKLQLLNELLITGREKFGSEDTSIVVFGSLARQEWTSKSDLDWVLLIDGQAHPEHLDVSQRIAHKLSGAKFSAPPGPTGTFGNMAFSHELIHQIGGEHDTNKNTTRRLLLLLESLPIGSADAYNRVVSVTISRYFEEDTNLLTADGRNFRVPRFLLNDMVRFWRTMAVDFAAKMREREAQGWALRNVKLRMSRKLIFVSGVLACLSCNREEVPQGAEPEQCLDLLVKHLKKYVSITPLETIAEAMLRYEVSSRTAQRVFDSYDTFLEVLNDENKRESLKSLAPEQWQSDKLFNEMREVSHEYQKGLVDLFFNENDDLSGLMKEYGVF